MRARARRRDHVMFSSHRSSAPPIFMTSLAASTVGGDIFVRYPAAPLVTKCRHSLQAQEYNMNRR